MTAPPLDANLGWTLIAVLGVGTFALRLSFIQLYAWLDEFPPRVQRALKFIPVAILSALIFPALISLDALASGAFVNGRLLAGVVAAVVAWRTNSFTATIVVGMGVLWGFQFVVA